MDFVRFITQVPLVKESSKVEVCGGYCQFYVLWWDGVGGAQKRAGRGIFTNSRRVG